MRNVILLTGAAIAVTASPAMAGGPLGGGMLSSIMSTTRTSSSTSTSSLTRTFTTSSNRSHHSTSGSAANCLCQTVSGLTLAEEPVPVDVRPDPDAADIGGDPDLPIALVDDKRDAAVALVLREHVPQLLEEVARPLLDPQQRRDLTDHDREGQPDDEPLDDRLGDEAGHALVDLLEQVAGSRVEGVIEIEYQTLAGNPTCCGK